MKELFKHNKLSEKQSIESIVKKKKDIEYKLEGSIKPLKGHQIWEINLKTMEINLAQYVERKDIHWWDAIKFLESGWTKDIQIKDNCVYISALNKKSALDRLEKEKGSAVIPNGKLELKIF
jgi:hypothetical protein